MNRASDWSAALDALPPAWAAGAARLDAPSGRADVRRRVGASRATAPIAPDDPFRALARCGAGRGRVVVFGQDPYPKPAKPTAWRSRPEGRPALAARIFQVLAEDRPGFAPPAIWKLDAWARQGVLLLNPALTIEVGRIGSHWIAVGRRSHRDR